MGCFLKDLLRDFFLLKTLQSAFVLWDRLETLCQDAIKAFQIKCSSGSSKNKTNKSTFGAQKGFIEGCMFSIINSNLQML